MTASRKVGETNNAKKAHGLFPEERDI